VLGAGGATHIMATLRALARDATSCIVLLDSDEEGLRERDRIGASGLMDPRGVFVVPPRAGCIETEFEDVFSPELYFAEVAQACGIAAGPPEFRLAQRQSGSRDTRMAKWSNVMAALCAANGHDWEALADGAKSALGAAIARTVDQVPQREIAFVSSIGAEVLRYLREG
jgi:putative ATP-dependent endonuclease of OLD family